MESDTKPRKIESGTPLQEKNTNSTDNEDEDDNHDPQFKPIVELPEVPIVTNEENETILLKQRAKLYRFDRNGGTAEWKERGTGELKILRHNENNSVRIVMRRDRTYKVCANHFITPWMTLSPSQGNEKSYIYTVAADFADETPKSECLAIKFANIENAKLFKDKFDEAKMIVLHKCDLYNGKFDEEQNEDDSCTSDVDEDHITNKLTELNIDK